ncbi:hypothetical protein Droror1_Dr00016261, partial [Drosera rotundifolia]
MMARVTESLDKISSRLERMEAIPPVVDKGKTATEPPPQEGVIPTPITQSAPRLSLVTPQLPTGASDGAPVTPQLPPHPHNPQNLAKPPHTEVPLLPPVGAPILGIAVPLPPLLLNKHISSAPRLNTVAPPKDRPIYNPNRASTSNGFPLDPPQYPFNTPPYLQNDPPPQQPHPPQLPRLEFPSFDGVEARSWIRKAERYFGVMGTEEWRKVEMAAMYLT